MSLVQQKTLAKFTFFSTLKSKTFLLFIILAIFYCLGAYNSKHGALPIINIFISFLSIVFLATSLGTTLIKNDFKSNSIPLILTSSLKRYEYFLSKIITLSTILSLFFLVFNFVTNFLLKKEEVIQSLDFKFQASDYLMNFLHKEYLDFSSLLLISFVFFFLIYTVILTATFYSFFLDRMACFFLTSFTFLTVFISQYYFYKVPMNSYFENLGFFKIIGLFFHTLFPSFHPIMILIISSSPQNEFTVAPSIIYSHAIVMFILLNSFFLYFTKKRDF